MEAVKSLTRFAVCLLIGAGLMAGCGQSPVSSDDALDVPVAAKKAQPSADENGIYTLTASKVFTAKKGGKIKVQFPKYIGNDGVQVRSAEFKVSKNALEDDVPITMEVKSGTSLEDIQVIFGPSGTSFSPSAELEIKFWGEKQHGFETYHYHADQVENAVVKNSPGGWKAEIEVPGFSRYTLNGGR